MFVSELALALLLAVLVTAVFVVMLGWRRAWDADDAGIAGAAVFFFVLMFLGTWATGVWMEPMGPTAWGVSWLGFVIAAIVLALVLAAASGRPVRADEDQTVRRDQVRDELEEAERSRPQPRGDEPADADRDAPTRAAWNAVFWVLVVVFLGLIILAYV